jgi:transcriptional regulator with XRE-family HTH domain
MKRTNEIIAENVARLRESKGLSQTDLAGKAKVSLHTVFRIEHANENVRPNSIRAVAGALGTTLEALEVPFETIPSLAIPANAAAASTSGIELTVDEIKAAIAEARIEGRGIERLRLENEALKAEIEKLKANGPVAQVDPRITTMIKIFGADGFELLLNVKTLTAAQGALDGASPGFLHKRLREKEDTPSNHQLIRDRKQKP